MTGGNRWAFKARLRARAFGWRGSKAAIARLKEAVAEIKAVNRIDAVVAGEGVVQLMARLWPAFQEIDTSSGALGTAVNAALADIIPILIAAPATPEVRAAWLERLYDAVQEDGVQYLYPAEQRWGEIAVYPELMNAYADLLLPLLRRVWCTEPADHYVYITGHTICLSCLLEAGRYEELLDLLTNARNRFWSDQRFGAEALTRQGHYDAALAFADACRRASIQSHDHRQIDRFCEGVLLKAGREEEAYRRYGPHVGAGTTYVAIYRDTLRRYPGREPRQVLLDLIEARGERGKWFAAAKAQASSISPWSVRALRMQTPATLVRAARDFAGKNAEFSAQVALLRAVEPCSMAPDTIPIRRTSVPPTTISWQARSASVPRPGHATRWRRWLQAPVHQAASKCSNRWFIFWSVAVIHLHKDQGETDHNLGLLSRARSPLPVTAQNARRRSR